MAGDAGGSPPPRAPPSRARPPPVSFGAAFALVAAVAAVAVGAFGLTSEVTLGIDLGTTYSVAATCEKGTVRVVRAEPTPADPRHPRVSFARPSCPLWCTSPVRPSLPPPGSPPRSTATTTPWSARPPRDSATPPPSAPSTMKRIIGRAFDDPDVADETAHLTFAAVPGRDSPQARVAALPRPGRSPDLVSPEDIGAHPRAPQTRRRASPHHSDDASVSRSVRSPSPSPSISTPRPRRRPRGERAGFRVARLLEEPSPPPSRTECTKALNGSMSSADGDRDGGRIVVVYDLGGGTLDVAVLRWETSARAFLVMATAGDPRLGGEDFDRALVGWLRDRLATEVTDASDGVTLGDDPASRETALRAMERAKRTLARRESVRVRVVASREGGVARRIDVEPFEDEDDSTEGSDTYVSTVTLTRAALEASCASLFEKSTAPVATALRRAGGVTLQEVDDVVMVGGSSRLVAVRERVREMFGDKVVTRAVDPDTAIAVGAAKSYAC